MTREFKSLGEYEVREHRVVSVILDREEKRDLLFARLQAEGVTIDGARVNVVGVESYAVQTLRKGSGIGLMVEERQPPVRNAEELRKAIDEREAATAELNRRLDAAAGALADIAFSDDMTLTVARRKAKRIYEQVRAVKLVAERREGEEG